MPERIPRCPTCNVPMELGFMPVPVNSVASVVPQWAAGEPVRNWWSGLKVKAPLGVTAYRCPNCGYLALYARAPTP